MFAIFPKKGEGREGFVATENGNGALCLSGENSRNPPPPFPATAAPAAFFSPFLCHLAFV